MSIEMQMFIEIDAFAILATIRKTYDDIILITNSQSRVIFFESFMKTFFHVFNAK